MRSQTRHCQAVVMLGGVVAPNKRSTTPRSSLGSTHIGSSALLAAATQASHGTTDERDRRGQTKRDRARPSGQTAARFHRGILRSGHIVWVSRRSLPSKQLVIAALPFTRVLSIAHDTLCPFRRTSTPNRSADRARGASALWGYDYWREARSIAIWARVEAASGNDLSTF